MFEEHIHYAKLSNQFLNRFQEDRFSEAGAVQRVLSVYPERWPSLFKKFRFSTAGFRRKSS